MSGKGNSRYIDGRTLRKSYCIDCGKVLCRTSFYAKTGKCRSCVNKRESNPAYKNGIMFYQQLAFEHYPKRCFICGTTDKLIAHHMNKDRKDNRIENLRIVCWSCHYFWHRPQYAK